MILTELKRGNGSRSSPLTKTADNVSNPDAARWNKKYRGADQADPVHPRGEPELAASRQHLAPAGTALEIAAGKGRNALYLATLGYDVIASDIAFSGISQCTPYARQHNLSVAPLVCDVTRFPFPRNHFDLVSVVRYLDRDLFQAIQGWIKPGGLLFYKTFNSDFLTIKPNFNPDYVVEIGELNWRFEECDVLSSDLDMLETFTVGSSSVLARKRI